MAATALLVGEREYFLAPTLRAARAVNQRFNGFHNAVDRVVALDMGAITHIVAAGINQRDPRDIEALEAEIFEAGLQDMVGPVCRFVMSLANGGRTATDEEPDPEKKS